MDEVFEIRTPAQLRALNTPATQSVVEAMQDLTGLPEGVSAAQIGTRAGLSAETAHYHLKKLVKIGLVRVAGQRDTGARPEKRYALAARHLELRPGRRTPAYTREVIRGVRLVLRQAEREFERASNAAAGDFETRPRIGRHVAWLTPAEVVEVDRMEKRLSDLLHKAEQRAHEQGRCGRERVAITMTLSPIERSYDSMS